MQLFLLVAIGGLAALAFAAWWSSRVRSRSREPAARLLCEVLDSYLDKLAVQEAAAFNETDALWSRLERAREIKRMHFPELYAEMHELSTAHTEWTALQLSGHMERHGAPTDWHAVESPRRLSATRERLESAVQRLRQRCRELAGLA